MEYWRYTAKRTSDVWFSNIRCKGDETHINDCVPLQSIFTSPCDYTQAIAVTCGISITSMCFTENFILFRYEDIHFNMSVLPFQLAIKVIVA